MSRHHFVNQKDGTRKRQIGTTTVEFAVVLPLFLLLTVGAIQLFRYSIIANAVETSVTEGARKGIIRGTTDMQVDAVVRQVLDTAGLTGYTVVINRTNLGGGATDLTIRSQLSLSGNGLFVPIFGTSWTVSRTCKIRCE